VAGHGADRAGFTPAHGGICSVVSDRRDDDERQRRAESAAAADAMGALGAAQLADARAEVFRAYVQARDKARELVDEEPRGDVRRERRRRPRS
jgi:hypothetical protein